MDNETIFHQARCISHEMRNHLSICELYTEIIRRNLEKDGYENPSVEDALKLIKKMVKVMGNSLLDLKSLDNFKPSRYDLKTLLEEAVSMAKAYAPETKFVLDTADTMDVFIDENKFLGCLINIFKNAIEAGAKEIKVNIEGQSVRISNSGAPIPSEKQKEIFSEGFTTKSTGCGLGLHICKNNLALQGAELKLIKSDKESTEFEIVFKSV